MEISVERKTEKRTQVLNSESYDLVDSKLRSEQGWMYGGIGSVNYVEQIDEVIVDSETDKTRSPKSRKVELSFYVVDRFKRASITHTTYPHREDIIGFDPKAEEIKTLYLSQPEDVRRAVEGLPEKVKGLIRLAVPELK